MQRHFSKNLEVFIHITSPTICLLEAFSNVIKVLVLSRLESEAVQREDEWSYIRHLSIAGRVSTVSSLKKQKYVFGFVSEFFLNTANQI